MHQLIREEEKKGRTLLHIKMTRLVIYKYKNNNKKWSNSKEYITFSFK